VPYLPYVGKPKVFTKNKKRSKMKNYNTFENSESSKELDERKKVFQKKVLAFQKINEESKKMLKEGVEYSKYNPQKENMNFILEVSSEEEKSENSIDEITHSIEFNEERDKKVLQKNSSNPFFLFFCCFKSSENLDSLYRKNGIN
jgi:hypothetical protein